ncbi:MAG: diacylglycerol kinase family protein [Limnohabitans sp.]
MVKPLVSQAARAVSRLASLGHAVRGLGVLLREPNARIHVCAAVCVAALGMWLRLNATDWFDVLLAMGLVLGAEALNTAVERLVDLVQPEWHPLARDAKDVAAAGVLICSLTAAAVGCGVFVPRLWALL